MISRLIPSDRRMTVTDYTWFHVITRWFQPSLSTDSNSHPLCNSLNFESEILIGNCRIFLKVILVFFWDTKKYTFFLDHYQMCFSVMSNRNGKRCPLYSQVRKLFKYFTCARGWEPMRTRRGLVAIATCYSDTSSTIQQWVAPRDSKTVWSWEPISNEGRHILLLLLIIILIILTVITVRALSSTGAFQRDEEQYEESFYELGTGCSSQIVSFSGAEMSELISSTFNRISHKLSYIMLGATEI